MNCIRPTYPDILHYGALHFAADYTANIEAVARVVQRDMIDSGLTIEDFKKSTVLLDFRCEGQCDKSIVNLIAYLRSIPVKGVAAIFNTEVDTSALDYPALSVTNHLVNFNQCFDKLKQHPQIWSTECNFLCLIRRPSISRAKLATRLLDVTKNLRLSFGSMCDPGELVEYQSMFKGISLPLLLDGKVIRDAEGKEYDVINPLFRTCAVNIIAESSCQSDPGVWRSIFVTEKTFKAFGMLQIPIWWAVPGLVACVRRMGFDVFDDIVDHSYDLEINEDQRLNMLINEIVKLDTLDLGNLRNNLRDRLLANWQLLDQISQNQSGQFNRILKDLNLDTQV